MSLKNYLKTPLWKNNATKMIFLCFASLKFSKLEIFNQMQDSYSWINGKKQTWQPLINKTGRFYIKLVLSIGTRGNSAHPPRSFSFCRNITIIGIWLYWNHFFNIKRKLKQQISQNTREELLYFTQNVWSQLISLFFIVNKSGKWSQVNNLVKPSKKFKNLFRVTQKWKKKKLFIFYFFKFYSWTKTSIFIFHGVTYFSQVNNSKLLL